MTPARPPQGLDATDRAWFGEQVESLLPELVGAACRLCGNEADAEDLVARSVARGWEKLDTLEDRSAFRGWLFRILNNGFVSGTRSARSRAVHESLDEDSEGFSLFEKLHQPILLWWGNPEMDFLNRLLANDMQEAIDRLPEEFRTVVVMVDVQGFSYREVAKTLDVPVGTVRSRLARARSRLQAALWEHAVEAGLRESEDAPDGPARPGDGNPAPGDSHPHGATHGGDTPRRGAHEHSGERDT